MSKKPLFQHSFLADGDDIDGNHAIDMSLVDANARNQVQGMIAIFTDMYQHLIGDGAENQTDLFYPLIRMLESFAARRGQIVREDHVDEESAYLLEMLERFDFIGSYKFSDTKQLYAICNEASRMLSGPYAYEKMRWALQEETSRPSRMRLKHEVDGKFIHHLTALINQELDHREGDLLREVTRQKVLLEIGDTGMEPGDA